VNHAPRGAGRIELRGRGEMDGSEPDWLLPARVAVELAGSERINGLATENCDSRCFSDYATIKIRGKSFEKAPRPREHNLLGRKLLTIVHN